jgi:hypothetical protein
MISAFSAASSASRRSARGGRERAENLWTLIGTVLGEGLYSCFADTEMDDEAIDRVLAGALYGGGGGPKH